MNNAKITRANIILLVIFSIVAIIFATNLTVTYADTTKATKEDYAPLYEKKALLEENLAYIFDFNKNDFYYSSNQIILKSKECDLIVIVENGVVVDSIEHDNMLTPAEVVLNIMACSAISVLVVTVIWLLLISIKFF